MDNSSLDDSNFPPELTARVRSELREGEQVFWVGQPIPRRYAWQALPVLVFAVPWTVFSLCWLGFVLISACVKLGQDGEVGWLIAAFALIGIPLVLFGVGMLSTPYWFYRHAGRTFYALTDRRAIVWKARVFGGVEVRSFGPQSLGKMYRNEYVDGTGDLVFEEHTVAGHDSDADPTTTRSWRGFMAIERVRQVEELTRRIVRAN